MKVPFLDLKGQYQAIKVQIQTAMNGVLDSCHFVGGPDVERFEKSFAGYCEAKYCVGVSNGTDALRFALMAIGLRPGDEVITAPNTFIATTEAITQAGGKPVFVDIDPKTYNIDIQKLEQAITKKTRVIIPVHLYGQPAEMDPILQLAAKNNLEVVEDACQAHGAKYRGKRVGALGRIGCFSFYPGKNLGAYGEGGAVVTNDETLALKIRMLREHGQKQKYIHEIEGYNGRLHSLQAAILDVKLKYLEEWNEKRRSLVRLYREELKDAKFLELPFEPDHVSSVYHLFVIRTKDRENLKRRLTENGIGWGLHYPIPLHLSVPYQYLGYKEGDFPISETFAEEILSLPMYPEMNPEQVQYVSKVIRNT